MYISLKIRLLCLFALSILGCNDTPQNNPSQSITVLKGATLFTGNGDVIKDATVLIKDDRIANIGSSLDYPKEAKVIDLNGKFITPGLVDAHVHFFQTAFFDARPDALNIRDSIPFEDVYTRQMENPQRYYEAYLRNGITAVYDVGAFNATLDFPEHAENNPLAPHIAVAGPLLTPVKQAANTFNTRGDTVMIYLDNKKTGIDHVKRATKRGATGIKIWQLNLQDTSFMSSLKEVATAVEKEGNQLIVHATNLDQAKEAIRLGARLLVHSVEDTLVDQEFLDLAKAQNTYYNPTLIVARGYYNTYMAVLGEEFNLKDPNNTVDSLTRQMLLNASEFQRFVNDTAQMRGRMQRVDGRMNQVSETMAQNLRKVHEAGIPIVVGTDAGNPGTVHGISILNEMEAMQEAGIPARDIIIMATKNGAEIMRRNKDFGTLEKGKIADLIILESDPSTDISNMRSITHFMRAGQLRKVTDSF